MMWKRLRIRKHEVGLWLRHGDLHKILGRGAYWLPGRSLGIDRVEIFNTLNVQFVHPLLEVIVRDPRASEWLRVVELTDTQRALVWKDGRLEAMLAPGRYAFWKGAGDFDVEVYDVRDVPFEHTRMEAVLAHADRDQFLDVVDVSAYERAVVFRGGELMRVVRPGRFVVWKQVRQVAWYTIDLREQVLDVVGQDIMTADKVTLRVNLVVGYRVTDAEKAVTVVTDHSQALYREAQLALRAAVGARTLEQLLSDKAATGDEVGDAIRGRAAKFGAEIAAVGLRDVILPGDMKTILNQVIEAQKQAEANLIRRREETAAARSQANTAKLLADNPVLLRMKELEVLQGILAGTKTTFILGQGELTEQVRGLIRGGEESSN